MTKPSTAWAQNQVEFKCKSKTNGASTEINDEIDFTVTEDTIRGLLVKVAYQHEFETHENAVPKSATTNQQTNGMQSTMSPSSSGSSGSNSQHGTTAQIKSLGGNTMTAPKIGGGNRVLKSNGQGGGSGNNQTQTEYDIAFDRIIEYAKSSASGGSTDAYVWESDEVVQNLTLLDWGQFSGLSNTNNGTVTTFTISTTDGLVTMTFHISRADQQGVAATANKIKIDFRLVNFPWVRNDTYVALVSSVAARQSVNVESKGGGTKRGPKGAPKEPMDVTINFADAISTSGYVPFGEFTWATTAAASSPVQSPSSSPVQPPSSAPTSLNATNTTANSTVSIMTTTVQNISSTIDVIATSPQSSSTTGSQLIAFSFVGSGAQNAADIYWDPQVGVGYSAGATSKVVYSLMVVFVSSMTFLCVF